MDSASAPLPGPSSLAEPAEQEIRQIPSVRGRTAKSCYLCNTRKVRCDRKKACSNCLRAGKRCVYPPTRPLSRRSRTHRSSKTSCSSSLDSPLAQNYIRESSVSTPSNSNLHSASGNISNQHSINGRTDEDGEERTPEEVLVQKGASSQYFNEILISRAIADGQEGWPDVAPSSIQPADGSTSPFLNAMGMLSAFSIAHPGITLSALHPAKKLAHILWNTYVENVESCSTFKVLHIPTDEARFYAAIDHQSVASFENQAIFFAVCFFALTSLNNRKERLAYYPEEQDQQTDLARFRLGIEQSLAKANLLDNPTVTTLKAFAIYLSAIRINNRGKGTWVLNGLAIRIAQSIGLHRNGEVLGLSPFESEIRRRLWWHFLARDGRSGEDCGMQNAEKLAVTSDVAEPLNVEDEDLYPEMTELPKPRKHFTSITFNNINVDFARTEQRLALIASVSELPPPDNVRAQIINDMTESVERRLQGCNPAIPRHRLAYMISHFVQRKFHLTSKLQWLSLGGAQSSKRATATDEYLYEALNLLEMYLDILHDESLRPYLWSTKAFPQYYVLIYVLWHLCVRPTGPVAQRAWSVLESVTGSLLWESVREVSGPTATVLGMLMTKAKAVKRQKDQENETTESGPLSEEALMNEDDGDVELGVEAHLNEFPDWSSLLENLSWAPSPFSGI